MIGKCEVFVKRIVVSLSLKQSNSHLGLHFTHKTAWVCPEKYLVVMQRFDLGVVNLLLTSAVCVSALTVSPISIVLYEP